MAGQAGRAANMSTGRVADAVANAEPSASQGALPILPGPPIPGPPLRQSPVPIALPTLPAGGHS